MDAASYNHVGRRNRMTLKLSDDVDISDALSWSKTYGVVLKTEIICDTSSQIDAVPDGAVNTNNLKYSIDPNVAIRYVFQTAFHCDVISSARAASFWLLSGGEWLPFDQRTTTKSTSKARAKSQVSYYRCRSEIDTWCQKWDRVHRWTSFHSWKVKTIGRTDSA